MPKYGKPMTGDINDAASALVRRTVQSMPDLALTRSGAAGPLKVREIAFVGLNPSTADETSDDPTVRRCIGFARRWGFGGMFMLNAFAYRSTDPRLLKTAVNPIGPRNRTTLLRTCRRCQMTVVCWGSWGELCQAAS